MKSWLQPGQSQHQDYNPEKNNIHGTFFPAFAGVLDDLQVPKLLSVRSADAFKIFFCCTHPLSDNYNNLWVFQVHHEFYNGNFLLLPGSIKFSFLKLTSDDKGRESRNYGVWGKMLDMIAAAYQLDHIIIDLVSLPYCPL